MTKKIQTLWVKVAASAKQATYRPLVPEFDEPCERYRQATRYSNTY